MKTQELLELAALDALGLLDEMEREAFDHAFRAAPPALQAQIRREQTRIAGDDSMLPKVEVPIGLKARVLAAWRDAVETVSRRTGFRRLVPGLALVPSRNVSPVWRAAAVGCAAACVVLSVAMLIVSRQFKEYNVAMQSIQASEVWRREFGATFERAFFSKGARFVQFDPRATDCKTEAVLIMDEKTKSGQFYCRELAASADSYMLVPLDKNGEPLLNDDGSPAQILCKIKSPTLETGSIFNQKIAIPDGASDIGLVVTKSDSDKPKLLLRSRNL